MAAERGRNLQPIARFGVGKGDRARMKVKLLGEAGNESILTAIFTIADDRSAQSRAMGPQLMGPAGARTEHQQQ